MQIVCPDCATTYQVDPTTVGPAGRKVRCARCKSSWVAVPEPEPVYAMAFSHPDLHSGLTVPTARAQDLPLSPDGTDGQADPTAEADIDASTADGQPARVPDGGESNPEVMTADTELADAADAPPLVPAPPNPTVIDGEGNDIETLAARRAQQMSKRRRLRMQSNFVLVIAALFAIDAALIVWRTNVVRLLPQTASLYAAIGLPVNLRSLVIRNVTLSHETHDGVPVLIIEGMVINDGPRPSDVPRLRFAALSGDNQELYAWTAMPVRTSLGAGEVLPFRSRLASPPADARDVLVRFLHRRDLTGLTE